LINFERWATYVIIAFTFFALTVGLIDLNQQKNEMALFNTAYAQAQESVDPWGEIVGDPVILGFNNRPMVYSFQVKDKNTGKIIIINVATSSSYANSAVKLE
jgi:hypothetical protein